MEAPVDNGRSGYRRFAGSTARSGSGMPGDRTCHTGHEPLGQVGDGLDCIQLIEEPPAGSDFSPDVALRRSSLLPAGETGGPTRHHIGIRQWLASAAGGTP